MAYSRVAARTILPSAGDCPGQALPWAASSPKCPFWSGAELTSKGHTVQLAGVPSGPLPGLLWGRRNRRSCSERPSPSPRHQMRGLIILWVDNAEKHSATGGCDKVS